MGLSKFMRENGIEFLNSQGTEIKLNVNFAQATDYVEKKTPESQMDKDIRQFFENQDRISRIENGEII